MAKNDCVRLFDFECKRKNKSTISVNTWFYFISEVTKDPKRYVTLYYATI